MRKTHIKANDELKEFGSTMALLKRGMLPAVVVSLCYMIAGPSLVLLNKRMLVQWQFPYPLTVACTGLIFSSVFSFILVRCLGLVKVRQIKLPVLFKNIVPIGIATAVTLSTGNFAYLHLSVAFIQVISLYKLSGIGDLVG